MARVSQSASAIRSASEETDRLGQLAVESAEALEERLARPGREPHERAQGVLALVEQRAGGRPAEAASEVPA